MRSYKTILIDIVSCFRVKDSSLLSDAFEVDPLYLKHENQGKMPDFRVGNWKNARLQGRSLAKCQTTG